MTTDTASSAVDPVLMDRLTRLHDQLQRLEAGARADRASIYSKGDIIDRLVSQIGQIRAELGVITHQ
jgi:hypothetical protein